ncbi:NAD(P)H-dependent oxidoreductase subunit E [Pseudothermotoga sp. U03pept]|uniref:NAD(P)H-dependent oxidoreductase subunit E n=1 Tax=Pseudothermotoga sp. U03pept TaxID=3447012 RepID=UPI003F0F869A
MVVRVCMGSSCHLKGSYKVVQRLEELRSTHPEIQIYGSLCFGNCSDGVCVEIDGKLYKNVNAENIKQILVEAKNGSDPLK